MAVPEQQEQEDEAQRARLYWRANRRLVMQLTLVWAAVSFLPPLFARELDFNLFGAPLSLWFAAQCSPLTFLLLIWYYERRMDRLDRAYRTGQRQSG